MNNEELMQKLKICVEEYKKLQIENEELKNMIVMEEEINRQLDTCIKETNKIIIGSKENLKSAEKCITEMQFLVDYYQRTTVILMERLINKAEQIKSKDGDIDEIIQEIKSTKESMDNLNNIDL